MSPSASKLASDFVQRCVDRSTHADKCSALKRIHDSLTLSFEGEEDVADERMREWRKFLESSSSGSLAKDGSSGGDDASGNDDGIDFPREVIPTPPPAAALRDALVECLVDHCPDDSEVAGENDVDGSAELVSACLSCLERLILVQCANAGRRKDGSSQPVKRPSSTPFPLFGPDFVAAVAPGVVAALNSDGSRPPDGGDASRGDDPTAAAASRLIEALLRSDRPKNESSPLAVRDSILLPASSSSAELRAVARVAEVLASSVVESIAAGDRLPTGGGSPGLGLGPGPGGVAADDEERSMRRETNALSRLQEMRDVFMNVASLCVLANNAGEESVDHDLAACGERVVASLQRIYDLAPYVVESQLSALPAADASSILSGLRKGNGEEEEGDGGSAKEKGDEDGNADGSTTNLPPFYADLSKAPLTISSLKSLESTLDAISDHLSDMDSEKWNVRMDSLSDIERILAGGAINDMGPEGRASFLEKIRKMSMQDQFIDLRSQITHHACRVIIAMAYEFRPHIESGEQSTHVGLSHFVESCLPFILRLSISGTRLMATQGMNCLLFLAALGGRSGFPRIIAPMCDECSGKKSHKNRKRGCVMALTAALRVWDPHCFSKHADKLAGAAKETAGDRDPGVREETRKLYWALISCEGKVSRAAEEAFKKCGSRETKQLLKVRAQIDAEWESGGAMDVLLRTGVLTPSSTADPAKKTDGPSVRTSSGIHPRPHGAKSKRNGFKRPAQPPVKTEPTSAMTKAARFSSPAAVVRSDNKVPLPASSGQGFSRNRTTMNGRRQPSPSLREKSAPPSVASLSGRRQPSPSLRERSESADTAALSAHRKPSQLVPARSESPSIPPDRKGLANDTKTSTMNPLVGNNSRQPKERPKRDEGEQINKPDELSNILSPEPVHNPSRSESDTIACPPVDQSIVEDCSQTVEKKIDSAPSDITSPSIDQENMLCQVRATPKTGTGFKASNAINQREEFYSPVNIIKQSVRFNFDPMTPVVKVLSNPCPLSVEKVKNSDHVLREIVTMLSNRTSRHEQYLGVQALALFAKDYSTHESWDDSFALVLECLLDEIKYISSKEDGTTPSDLSFVRSPAKKLGSRHEAQHLFLQGLRALLQFLPGKFIRQVREMTTCLLQCTENSPFEIVHTAEHALQNLVSNSDPCECLKCLLSFLVDAKLDLKDKNHPPLVLSCLRTLRCLIDRVPKESLAEILPLVIPLFQTTLRHKSVDMRKVTVFIIVEMHFVLRDLLQLNLFTDSQQKLIRMYVDRHPKKSLPISEQESSIVFSS